VALLRFDQLIIYKGEFIVREPPGDGAVLLPIALAIY